VEKTAESAQETANLAQAAATSNTSRIENLEQQLARYQNYGRGKGSARQCIVRNDLKVPCRVGKKNAPTPAQLAMLDQVPGLLSTVMSLSQQVVLVQVLVNNLPTPFISIPSRVPAILRIVKTTPIHWD